MYKKMYFIGSQDAYSISIFGHLEYGEQLVQPTNLERVAFFY
jgi:hypothetical protein